MTIEFVTETKTESSVHPIVSPPEPQPNTEYQSQLNSKFLKFQFLNSHGSQLYTPASRTAARAHVMRHVSREKDARQAASGNHGQFLSNTVLVADPKPGLTRNHSPGWPLRNIDSDASHNLELDDGPTPSLKSLAETYQRPEVLPDQEISLEPISSLAAQELPDHLSSFRRDPFIVFPVHADRDVHSLFIYCKDNASLIVVIATASRLTDDTFWGISKTC